MPGVVADVDTLAETGYRMCGIVGFWPPNPIGDERAHRELTAMHMSLEHRGPDGYGTWRDVQQGVSLGHRRLSILDLSPAGAQPMLSASGRFAITFNGEIYNFGEIRNQLRGMGVEFRGGSDTEVLLAAIEQWGALESLRLIRGMFAFAVWDSQRGELLLARDRIGEKPLYFAEVNDTLLFASELRALRAFSGFSPEVSPSAIVDILQRGYVRGERSVFAGVHRLSPGTACVITRGLSRQLSYAVHRYWGGVDVLGSAFSPANEPEALDSLQGLIESAVREQLVSDVPIGAFLSGGVDSSIIVAAMQRVSSQQARTFTVAFEDPQFDESSFAQLVADHLGTSHTEIRLPVATARDIIEELPRAYDEPFADSSQIPTLLISREIRRHVTVALSGDGGDELFGGYPHYWLRDRLAEICGKVPARIRPATAALSKRLPHWVFGTVSNDPFPENVAARLRLLLGNATASETHESRLSAWVDGSRVLSASLKERLKGAGSPILRVWPELAPTDQEARMRYDLRTYLADDILVKVDRAAMYNSLETRAPFLDQRIVEFAAALPLHQKVGSSAGKLLLRKLLNRYVPPEITDRPKRGFAVPVSGWLRSELRPWAEGVLLDQRLLSQWFDSEIVLDLWRRHLAGQDHGSRLWRVLAVLHWSSFHSIRA